MSTKQELFVENRYLRNGYHLIRYFTMILVTYLFYSVLINERILLASYY